MFKFTIICVGKLKEKHWQAAQDEFLLRLKPHAKVDVLEVKAEAFGATRTPEQAMRTEAERLLGRLPADAVIIALERAGAECSSPSFSEFLKETGGTGSHLVFVIGGASGLDARVLASARKKISLSKMTLTHEMARIFLLEQVYRAMTILAGKTYHY